jgi:hypothetical protein
LLEWFRESRYVTVQCNFCGGIEGIEDEFRLYTFLKEQPSNDKYLADIRVCMGSLCLYLVGEKLESQLSSVNKTADLASTQKANSCAIYTSSQATMQLSRQWLQNCLALHQKCSQRASETPTPPSRLIDVTARNGSDLHLYETSPGIIIGPYATLSYCWGGKNEFRLTLSSLQHFKTGFALSDLPQTIQDAIHVTRHLGIRYLWIDALCIIQDSPEDWRKEVATMSQVYRNSLVTIGALGATNSEEGLFSQRDPLVRHPCWMLKKAEGTNLYFSPMQPFGFDDAPLHDRGWVMQERILSPRTLNFGSYIIWECCQDF